MPVARSYQDLVVWQKAMTLVETVYRMSRTLPDEERFGLVSQMRRAAISVPSNIAEGQGRGSSVEFVRFLRIAGGSLQELETQLLLAMRLEMIGRQILDEALGQSEEVGRMLNGLIRSIQNSDHPAPRGNVL